MILLGVAVTTNWFIVIKSRDAWWIDNAGTAIGPYPSRDAACADSTRVARSLRRDNVNNQVYWPDEEGHLRLIFEHL